jgi:universal stress protein A
MAGYKNVLAAVDLAGDMDEALTRAIERTVADGGTLSIVHVLEPAYYYYGMEPALGTLPPSFEEDLLKRANDQLAEVGAKYGVPRARQYLERGHAPTQILRLAQDKNVDLIIVGSHGRHGWRLVLGSTANAVLHGARCDVLAARVAPPK